MIAALFDVFVDLIRHFRCRCIATRRISKHEGIIEFDFFDQSARLLVIMFGLTRKSNDDVGRDRDSLSRVADLPDKIGIFFGGISAVHRLQNFV